jgi:hypothetical protein
MNQHVPETLEAATRPKRRWPTILAGAVLLVLTVSIAWATWYYQRDPYRVVLSGGVVQTNLSISSIRRSGGPQCALKMYNTFGRDLADAECTVDRWTDDKGANLLLTSLSSGRAYHMYEAKGCGWLVSTVDGSIWWYVKSPAPVSTGAKTMHLEGRIRLVEGVTRSTERIENFAFKEGESFRIGDSEYSVVDIHWANQDPYRTVCLQAAAGCPSIARVGLLKEDGAEIASSSDLQYGLSRIEKKLISTEQGSGRIYEIIIPHRLTRASLIVEYWSQVQAREIPFKGDLPIEWVDTERVRWPSFPIAADGWGPKGDEEPADLFEVVSESCTRRTDWLALETIFGVKSKANHKTTSYAVTLTSCVDNKNRPLLGAQPLRSDDLEAWGVCEQRDGAATFQISTNRQPPSDAESLTYTGVVKIKTAHTPRQVVIKDVVFRTEPRLDVGPVQFTPENLGFRDKISVFRLLTRGDVGLVRKIGIESADGVKLYEGSRDRPNFYWNDGSTWSLDEGEIDDVAAETFRQRLTGKLNQAKLTFKATYLSQSKHYILPFSITVPLPLPRKTPTPTTQPQAAPETLEPIFP